MNTTNSFPIAIDAVAALRGIKPKPNYAKPDLGELTNEFLQLLDSKMAEGAKHRFGLNTIMVHYFQPHRHYHTFKHLFELFYLINKISGKFPADFIFDLKIVALFHDAVYNPRSDRNEMDSALLFKEYVEKATRSEMHSHPLALRWERIWNAILDTQTHKPSNDLSAVFCKLDMFVISHYSFRELLEYEHQIFKEFQFVPYDKYKIGRVDVLYKLNEAYNRPEIDMLAEYVKFRTPRVGVYAGSFRPFHIGHYDILFEAERMFDKVIIVRGVNPAKESSQEFLTNLEETFPYHEVDNFNGYIFDYLNNLTKKGVVPYYIKGLRNSSDYESQAKEDCYNRQIFATRYVNAYGASQMNTVCILGNRNFSHISSSDIRAMEKIEPGSGQIYIYNKPKL